MRVALAERASVQVKEQVVVGRVVDEVGGGYLWYVYRLEQYICSVKDPSVICSWEVASSSQEHLQGHPETATYFYSSTSCYSVYNMRDLLVVAQPPLQTRPPQQPPHFSSVSLLLTAYIS